MSRGVAYTTFYNRITIPFVPERCVVDSILCELLSVPCVRLEHEPVFDFSAVSSSLPRLLDLGGGGGSAKPVVSDVAFDARFDRSGRVEDDDDGEEESEGEGASVRSRVARSYDDDYDDDARSDDHSARNRLLAFRRRALMMYRAERSLERLVSVRRRRRGGEGGRDRSSLDRPDSRHNDDYDDHDRPLDLRVRRRSVDDGGAAAARLPLEMLTAVVENIR